MTSGRYTKVVTGYEDVFLTGEPRTSYFLIKYTKKLHEYETYIIETNILDQVNYGTLLRIIIPEKGDIIKGIIIKLIVPTDYISVYASYAIIEYCDLIIGGQLIERLTGEYMSLLLDKKCSTVQQQSIGIFSTTISNKNLKNDAGFTQLFFEIPFYFFNQLNLGIPICALYKHKIELNVKIKEWTLLKETNFYINATRVSSLITPEYSDNKKTYIIPMKVFSTLIEYIKVPDEIRERIKNSTMSYIITQTQLQLETIPKYVETFDTGLKFINPVHNLLFYFRTKNNIYRKQYGGSSSRLDDLKYWGISETPPNSYVNSIKNIVITYGNPMSKLINGTESTQTYLLLNVPSPGSPDITLSKRYITNENVSDLQHIISIELKFNGETIIDPDNSGNFLMMNQVHKLMNKGTTNTPMIYTVLGVVPDYSPCYYFHSFAEDFKSGNPGGQVNFSRIRDKDLHINLVPSLYDRILSIYAQSNNVLKVKDGMAGLMFTSPTAYDNHLKLMPKSWYYNSVYFSNLTTYKPEYSIFSPDLQKKQGTPYIYKYYPDRIWTYDGSSYSQSSYLNFKYIDTPDIIVDDSIEPPLVLS